MNNAKKIIGALLITAAVGTSVVAAQSIHASAGVNPKNKIPQADRQKLMTLVESGDFNGWKALMTQDGLSTAADKVTADKFAKMTELANEMIKVEALRKEIGPIPGFGMGMESAGSGEKGMGGKGMMHGRGPGANPAFDKLPQAAKDQLKTAFENHDKAAIEKILKDNGITPPKGRMNPQDENFGSSSTTNNN